jgi:hypothetical protein
MALFGRRKKKSLFEKSTRLEFKSKRRVFGRASISETKSPYSNAIRPEGKLKVRKKIRRTSASKLATPPGKLSHPKTSRFKKILLLLLSLFIIGGSCYFIFFTDFFQIQDYQIYDEGSPITSNLEINELASQLLLNQNILLFNETELSQQILKASPEYRFVEIKKILPRSIEIELERFPVAANIINIIDGADGIKVQKKYLVNTNGMIIMENEDNPDLPYIRVSTKQALGINSYPLDQEKLDYIIKLVAVFEEKFGIKIVEAIYLKQAREVHLRTEKGFDVWFDQTKNMLSQIDKLKRALPKLDIYTTPLQYIDLRITSANAEKVIYKKR